MNASTLLGLSALYTSMGGARWHRNQGWLRTPPSGLACPAWIGVLACSKKSGKGAGSGPIRISLSGPFTGTIPTQLGALSELRDFELSSNTRELSGTLPTQLGSLSALQELRLSGRVPRLSGTLPAGLGQISLDVLSVRTSLISGTLPVGIGARGRCGRWSDPAQLAPALLVGTSECHFNTWIRLPHNKISGTLPAAFATAVGELDLQHNALSGSIPSSLAGMHHIRLGGNSRLSGTVPTALGTSPGTWTLSLDGTRVAGQGSHSARTLARTPHSASSFFCAPHCFFAIFCGLCVRHRWRAHAATPWSTCSAPMACHRRAGRGSRRRLLTTSHCRSWSACCTPCRARSSTRSAYVRRNSNPRPTNRVPPPRGGLPPARWPP